MGACVRRRVAARARAFAAIETRIVRVRVIGPTVSRVSSASAPGVFGSSRSRGGALVKVSFRLPSFGSRPPKASDVPPVGQPAPKTPHWGTGMFDAIGSRASQCQGARRGAAAELRGQSLTHTSLNLSRPRIDLVFVVVVNRTAIEARSQRGALVRCGVDPPRFRARPVSPPSFSACLGQTHPVEPTTTSWGSLTTRSSMS